MGMIKFECYVEFVNHRVHCVCCAELILSQQIGQQYFHRHHRISTPWNIEHSPLVLLHEEFENYRFYLPKQIRAPAPKGV